MRICRPGPSAFATKSSWSSSTTASWASSSVSSASRWRIGRQRPGMPTRSACPKASASSRQPRWKRAVSGSWRTNPSRASVPRIFERLALPCPSLAARRESATPSGWPANASSTRIARDTEATRTPGPSAGWGIGLIGNQVSYLAPRLPPVKRGQNRYSLLL
ncbi:MAG: hypothetical protein A3I14_15415 [Candidatus Rokubacteria bacterium RIFCSPLOWO2_02_FULL_73_56]|nr:MAG: hypothetical protein A3I14_15415 [Candidatus Rokubacteria bacterium RIFCSPLOWO2_02_FULL_73_56]